MTSYVERLARRSREVGSFVCVGLDLREWIASPTMAQK